MCRHLGLRFRFTRPGLASHRGSGSFGRLSRCFSLVKALLLPACAAAVALLPHFFTSRPAFSSVGCRSSFSSLRVTSSPEPSAPSLRLMPTQCFTACVVQLLPQQLCWVPLAHFTEEDSGSQRSGEIGPRSHCLSVVDPGPGFWLQVWSAGQSRLSQSSPRLPFSRDYLRHLCCGEVELPVHWACRLLPVFLVVSTLSFVTLDPHLEPYVMFLGPRHTLPLSHGLTSSCPGGIMCLLFHGTPVSSSLAGELR